MISPGIMIRPPILSSSCPGLTRASLAKRVKTLGSGPRVTECLYIRRPLPDRVVHGHQLGAVGEGRLDLDLVDHLGDAVHHLGAGQHGAAVRSEEHTSELQSLMRISYAVFCLKKKTSTTNIYTMHIPSHSMATDKH